MGVFAYSEIASWMAVILIGYLLGSIPISYLLVRWRKGIDIRTVGSGNAGATNTMRVLGPWWGGLCLLLDLLKGVAAIWVARAYFFEAGTWGVVMCGAAAIAGHSWPLWLSFRGGKGVATSTGVFLALAPQEVLICAAVVILVMAVSRYVSLGSLAGAFLLPALIVIRRGMVPVSWFALAAGILVILRHRGNIARLLKGKENRIGASKPKNKTA